MNYSLSSEIQSSLFETKTFLIENENTTLIAYSVIFGSNQIFKHFMLNNVDFKS